MPIYPDLINVDGFVKSPDTALRCILRRCSVPKSTLHSSGFARLACELFTKPSLKSTFCEGINVVIERGVLFLVIFTPLAFGTVQPWSTAIMEIAAFILFFLYLIKKVLENRVAFSFALTSQREPSRQGRFLLIFSILIFLWSVLVLFQMLPVPASLLRLVSPASLATYRDFANSPAGAFHPVSLNPDATRQEFFRFLSYGMIFFIIITHYRTQPQLNTLIKALLVMGGFLVIFALVQKATWNGRIFWIYPVDESISSGGGIWGPYINRDHFAGYLEMIIPLGMGALLYQTPRVPALPGAPLTLKIARFMASENLTRYGILFLSILMMVAVLFATFSRGGILAFVFSSLFFAWITWRRRSLKHKTGLLALLAVVILGAVILASWDRLEERFAALEQDHVDRLTVWTDSIGIIRDYPLLGTGLGTFKDAYMRYQTSMPRYLFDHAHNDYVELLTETGFVGFILGMGIVLFFFRTVFWRWRQKHSSFGKCIGAGGLTSLAAIAVHSGVDFNLHIPANAMLFAVISAITYTAVFNISEKGGAPP